MNREQRFFNQIEDVLHSYNEEYIPGTWEEFSREKRKRRRTFFIWQLTGAAAVLLLFTYVVFEFFNMNTFPKKIRTKMPSNQEIVSRTKDISITKSDDEKVTTDQGQKRLIHEKKQLKIETAQVVSTSEIQYSVKDSANISIVKKTIEEYIKDKVITNQTAKIMGDNKTGLDHRPALPDTGLTKSVPNKGLAKNLPFGNDANYNQKPGRNAYDSLTNRNNTNIKPKKDKNVIYSLVLSPALGNQKLNFGTGMEISYKIGNNLSFNGGVMYSSMNAGKNGNDGGTADKKIQDVALSISGFEVPIGLEYRTKGGFYATAGISGMSVISDRLEYNYLTQTTQTVTIVSGGVPHDVVRIVSQESTERSQEKIRNYIGFYTFSVGTKKAFGSNNVKIGPFIKIPFGNVSSEKIKLVQGGFRLGLDF